MNDVDKTTDGLASDSFVEVGDRAVTILQAAGDRVVTILQAAQEVAERTRRDAHEEAATIRSQAEKDAAARIKRLTKEIEQVNSERQTGAQSLRDEGERCTDDRKASPPPPSAQPVEAGRSLSPSVEQLRQAAAALGYEDAKLHAVVEAVTVSLEGRPLALATVPSSWDEPAVATLARPQGRGRTLLSTMSNWGHLPIAALARRSAPPSLPTEAGVRNVAKMTEADLPREGSLGVGDRVGAILAAAEEDAERMRREVHEEAAAIRHQTEKALASGTAELTQVIERIKSEAVTDARSLRDEAEHYAVEHLQSANERAAIVIARAEAKAQARRASAEEAARLVDETSRRQVALKEAADALEEHLRAGVEERLSAAHQGLQNLTNGLEEILSEKLTDAEVEEETETRQKAG